MKTNNAKVKTRVIFRVFNDGEVIALFPHIKEQNGCVLSYMHIGQHGSASPLIVHDTKPATPEQYSELLKELIYLGYNPIIGARVTKSPQGYNERKEAAREEAITWLNAEYYDLSYSELAEAAEHFHKLGKRYGLLREFKENAII